MDQLSNFMKNLNSQIENGDKRFLEENIKMDTNVFSTPKLESPLEYVTRETRTHTEPIPSLNVQTRLAASFNNNFPNNESYYHDDDGSYSGEEGEVDECYSGEEDAQYAENANGEQAKMLPQWSLPNQNKNESFSYRTEGSKWPPESNNLGDEDDESYSDEEGEDDESYYDEEGAEFDENIYNEDAAKFLQSINRFLNHKVEESCSNEKDAQYADNMNGEEAKILPQSSSCLPNQSKNESVLFEKEFSNGLLKDDSKWHLESNNLGDEDDESYSDEEGEDDESYSDEEGEVDECYSGEEDAQYTENANGEQAKMLPQWSLPNQNKNESFSYRTEGSKWPPESNNLGDEDDESYSDEEGEDDESYYDEEGAEFDENIYNEEAAKFLQSVNRFLSHNGEKSCPNVKDLSEANTQNRMWVPPNGYLNVNQNEDRDEDQYSSDEEDYKYANDAAAMMHQSIHESTSLD